MSARESAGVVLGASVSELAARLIRLLSVLPLSEGRRIARRLHRSITEMYPGINEDAP